ncbi:MAG: LPXTG cell wall anchor domain-containing protein [Oscillospiraceae bacterium]|nr:LPXTG cell wall anchor domain-containing protein [Oscillospiraceae bacterium]
MALKRPLWHIILSHIMTMVIVVLLALAMTTSAPAVALAASMPEISGKREDNLLDGSDVPDDSNDPDPSGEQDNTDSPCDYSISEAPDYPPAASPKIVFPDGTGYVDFPGICLNTPQPDTTNPGGTERGAPPVSHYPGDMLTPQKDDNGEIYFIEFDSNGDPMGVWRWNDDELLWMFSDLPPLGELPQTGATDAAPYLLVIGVALLALGIVGRKRRLGA